MPTKTLRARNACTREIKRYREAARQACVESLESRTLLSVSVDANGFTTVTPTSGDRIIYVSSSQGNDSNSGLSPSTPVKTIAQGESLLDAGVSNQLLLKRGDTWYENLGSWQFAGLSAQDPSVIGAYGTGNRPVLKTGFSDGLDFFGSGSMSNVYVLGIDFYASARDPNSPDFSGTSDSTGVLDLMPGSNLFIEDCAFQAYKDNVVIEPLGAMLTNFTLRRSIIVDSYSVDAHSQGLYMSSVDGALIEQNVFDHNGWNTSISGAEATIFNHNMYLQYSNSGNVTVRGNISAEASSHGAQLRSGGVADSNLFVNDAISLLLGTDDNTDPNMLTNTGQAINNVILNGSDIANPDPSISGPRGWGLDLNPGIGWVASGNIIAHSSSANTEGEAIGVESLSSGATVSNNIIYQWPGDIQDSGAGTSLLNNTIDGTGYPSPTRSIGSYDATLGGPGTLADFLNAARNRAPDSWNSAFAAAGAINYIRVGFGLAPLNSAPATSAVAPAPSVFGVVDSVSSTNVVGWAFNPKLGAAAAQVRVDIDGVVGTPVNAAVARADLAAAFGSGNHGYNVALPTNLTPGTHRLDVFALSSTGPTAVSIGSYTIISNHAVQATVESASISTVVGWAFDPDSPAQSVTVRVRIDGQLVSLAAANVLRTDVTFPTANQNHGFVCNLPALAPGQHTVEISAQDLNTGTYTVLTQRQIQGNTPPMGAIDSVTPAVAGWAYDPDGNGSSIYVRVDVDNVAGTPFLANLARSDLTPIFGAGNFGYSYTMPNLGNGIHTVTVYALDATSMTPRLLGTRAVVVGPDTTSNLQPFGSVDVISSSTVAGWTYDPNAGAAPVSVRIDIDGTTATTIAASSNRPDLAVVTSMTGTLHGFNYALSTFSAGDHRVDVYAIDNPSSAAVLMRSGWISTTRPFGTIDIASGGVVSGWAYDASGLNNTRVRLDIDGVPGNIFTVNTSRPDVTAALGVSVPGSNVGYSLAVPSLLSGSHSVSLYVIEGSSDRAVLIASRDLSAHHSPMGVIDILNNNAVSGWNFDADSGAAPVNVVISVDNQDAATVTANNMRSDLVSVVGSGNHGYSYAFGHTISAGQHTITIRAIDPETGDDVVLGSALVSFV